MTSKLLRASSLFPRLIDGHAAGEPSSRRCLWRSTKAIVARPRCALSRDRSMTLFSPAELDPWIERAKTSLVAALANGVTKDRAAVSAALSSGWSNGQAEGQICKLKLVKRQMYGRGKLDLLQARVIGLT